MVSDTESTQAASIAENIRTMILDGTFVPGQPLRQDALSKQLGVSRTPLRHALQSLAEDGMVEATGYKGARVATLDHGAVGDLFEMRLLLEPLALQSAFGKHTKLDFARAEMALDSAEDELEPSKLSALNWEFHYALYRPSVRSTLLKTIEQINRASALAELIASSIMARQEESAAEHRKLLKACQTGDEEAAVSILIAHLQRAYREVRQGNNDAHHQPDRGIPRRHDQVAAPFSREP
jgi:DNA-binding GntR family transcriptional regulator